MTNGSRPQFRFIDLFAGIGGLRRGFDIAGGDCVFTSEIDANALKTYQANFPDGLGHVVAGDIRQVQEDQIPEHDVLLAGFPCQPFSIAGISKKNAIGQPTGFRCDTQGTLFFDTARIIAHHRPQMFVLENVKNLVNHDKGDTFRIIRETLQVELGYNITYRVIDAKGYVPQHRERIFIVGYRDGNGVSLDSMDVPDPRHGPRLVTILHSEDGTEMGEERFIDRSGRVNKRYILTSHMWRYLRDYAAKHRMRGNGFGFGLVGPDDVARTMSARYYKDGVRNPHKARQGNPSSPYSAGVLASHGL